MNWMYNKELRKLCYIFTATVVILLIFGQVIYPRYKAEGDEEKRQESATERKKADERAEEYIKEYAAQLQTRMRTAGMNDLTVTYTEWADEIFDEYFGIKADEDADYVYYYVVSYQSEEINQIYAEDTKDGSYDAFIQLMDAERSIKNSRYDPEYHRHKIKFGDKIIAVYIDNEDHSTQMTIEGIQGATYCLDTGAEKPRLLVDDEAVNVKQEENDTTDTSTSSSGGMLDIGSTDSMPSSDSSSSSRRTDPYDVYDYDDPNTLQMNGRRNLEMEIMMMGTTMRMITGKMQGVNLFKRILKMKGGMSNEQVFRKRLEIIPK